eukprot:553889_1
MANNNTLFEFNIIQWNSLKCECKCMEDADEIKRIVSNGFHERVYHIKAHNQFSIQYIIALKLYTDYSQLCDTFCSTLRSEKKIKIAEIANWAKLLSECVQCFGSSLKWSERKHFYRGVSKAFIFEMFITRWNLPTSTTINFAQSANFAKDGGLIFELRNYKDDIYDVFKFECSRLSAFDREKEVLFFGGDTVLRLSSIWQWYNGKWKCYRKFVEALNSIIRMINGLPIGSPHVVTNKKYQQFICYMLTHRLNSQPSTFNLPPYIEELLSHHTSKSVITLNFNDLVNECKWMSKILMKQSDTEQILISISNICILFSTSDEIVFLMPNGYCVDDVVCKSLINDLGTIANMGMSINIKLKWPTQIPSKNRFSINKYLQQLMRSNWTREFSRDSVLFECGVSSYNISAQQLFQSKAAQLISVPLRKKKKKKNANSH